MLEEAMAQLTANQEKIAESEGKGPTWEDKVRNLSHQLPPRITPIIRPPGTTVPDGLIFCRRCFFFRHAFSEIPRPIALKLCHMIENRRD